MKSDIGKVVLEEIIENSPAFIAILSGPEFVFQKVNAKYLELVGHRDVLGKPLREALPEVMDQGFFEILQTVVRTGEKFVADEIPVDLQRSPGGPIEKRFVDLVYQRILDENGDPKDVFAHGFDVTEKVLARQKIEESERHFRTFADAMPHMAFVANAKGDITFFNKRWYEYIQGIAETEGWGWKDKPIHHPEDLERTIELWTRALKTGETYEIEYRLRRFDGEYRWHVGKAYPQRNSDGSIERWIGTNTDIHDYRQTLEDLVTSESRFRTMANAMPQMVWSTRPDGYHDYFNDRWYEYTGVPYGSTSGDGWAELFHPDDRKRAWEVWEHSLKSGEPYRIEYRLRFNDGTYRWTLGRALPIRRDDGTITRWMGTCTDIHDIKLNEARLEEIQSKLQSSLFARDEFLSVASHELKTPLTAMKLHTQSLRRNLDRGRLDQITPERLHTLVTTSEKQIGKIVRLVDDMLDLTRIQSGKLSFSFEEFSLAELLREVLDRLSEQLTTAGCEVTLTVQTEKRVPMDRYRIEQVIINLLTNTMRYAKAKPLRISLTDHGNRIRVSVQDQGIGVAPENLELIFNRFERAVSANEISGLGLGLYISKQIIEGHHGRIWAESAIGVGSTFSFELPLLGGAHAAD